MPVDPRVIDSTGALKLPSQCKRMLVIGGGIIVGQHAGDLIDEICLAIEMGCNPADIGQTIHPHPPLCESVGLTAEAYLGVCTDLPPQRKH